MNRFIKVSVVLPVFNVESYIAECLESLLNQTLKEIEIILINDCSTDNSGLICDDYALLDTRVKVIHNEENIKQGLSRNKGIEIARGEYISFIDPDDWVDLDFFEKLYEAAKSTHSDIVKTETVKVYPGRNKKKQVTLNSNIKKGLKKNLPIFLLFTYEHTTAIFKRDLIIKHNVRYLKIRNAEDNFFLLNATYCSKSISLISGTYYYYRQHVNSTISVHERPYFESILQYFRLYVDFINTHEMDTYHYNLAFFRGFYSVKSRYMEISKTNELVDFKDEYVERAFEIVSQYKYDPGYLLDVFYSGLVYNENVTRLKSSYFDKFRRFLMLLLKRV